MAQRRPRRHIRGVRGRSSGHSSGPSLRSSTADSFPTASVSLLVSAAHQSSTPNDFSVAGLSHRADDRRAWLRHDEDPVLEPVAQQFVEATANPAGSCGNSPPEPRPPRCLSATTCPEVRYPVAVDSADGSAEPLGQLAEQILLVFTDPRHVAVRPQQHGGHVQFLADVDDVVTPGTAARSARGCCPARRRPPGAVRCGSCPAAPPGPSRRPRRPVSTPSKPEGAPR